MNEQPLRIVMIDDDEDYYILVRDLLSEAESLRVHLTWHDSYEKGLAALSQNHTDIYLVDYRLGANTGLDLLREARTRKLTTPFILLTGQGDQEIAVEAMKAGATDYLVKGQIDVPLIERALRHAVETAKGRTVVNRMVEIMECTNDLVGSCAPNTLITYMNRAGRRMLGLGEEEDLAELSVKQFYPPAALKQILNVALPTADRDGYWSGETVLLARDGRQTPVLQAIIAHKDATGTTEYYSSTCRDITEHKRGEEQLRFQKTMLESQGEASIDGILVVAPDGKILSYNRRFVELWAIPADVIASQSDEAALQSVLDKLAEPAEFLAKVRHLYEHTVEEARDEVLLKDGRLFDRYTAPVKSAEGHHYGRVWFFRDITDRKRTEEANARLAAAVEQSAEVIVITDTQGLMQYVNPAFERVTGYSRAEAVGRNPRLLKSGQQNPEFYESMWTRLAEGKVWTGQLTNRRKDGSLYEAEATITPVRDQDGKIINFVAVSRDVTYQLSIEEQLRQSQKMQAIGRLAGGVAHDFNNILTVIGGYCAMLTQKTPESDPRRKDVEQIQRSSERAAALTKQLLAFSRKQLLNPKVLNINSVITGMTQMLERLIGENIELRPLLADNLPCVKADAGQIEQVIMNMAVNARDAMPTGGKLIVETRLVKLESLREPQPADFTAGDYVRITITDNGVGMTDEVKAHLFEPFFTTKGLGQGTGLGLATCYGIIKQSAGHIIVYSELGHGTAFKIYLPAVTERVESTTVTATPQPQRGHETILLVEDEDALRDLGACILQENGYTVLTARNGREGVELAKKHGNRIDLIVTDVIMPVLGGKDMFKEIQPILPRARVMFMSGYTDDALAEHGVLEPGIFFLEKPFSPARLSYKVREILDVGALSVQ